MNPSQPLLLRFTCCLLFAAYQQLECHTTALSYASAEHVDALWSNRLIDTYCLHVDSVRQLCIAADHGEPDLMAFGVSLQGKCISNDMQLLNCGRCFERCTLTCTPGVEHPIVAGKHMSDALTIQNAALL